MERRAMRVIYYSDNGPTCILIYIRMDIIYIWNTNTWNLDQP